MKRNNFLSYTTTTVLIVFALLTLFLSSSVIFDWFGVRAKEGNYVPFVVWGNFISSWMYLLAAYGYTGLKKWTYKLLLATALILVIVMIGLFVHIHHNGLFEPKTINALIFRITLTLVFAFLAYVRIKKK